MSDDKISDEKANANSSNTADGDGNVRIPLAMYRGPTVGNPEGYHSISLHELNAVSVRGLQAVEPGQKSTPVLVPVDATAAPVAVPAPAAPVAPAAAPVAPPALATAAWGGTAPGGK